MPRDNAPIKNTCPIIDDVVRYVDDWRNRYSDDESESEFKDALSILEDIRSANSTLRDWGNEEYKRAEDLEKERDELQKENERLQSDITYLQSEMQYYQAQLNESNNQ